MYQRWIEDHVDHGVVHGTVRDVDDDRDTGAVLWGIEWDDGTKSDYTLQDMQNYCVSNKRRSEQAKQQVPSTQAPHLSMQAQLPAYLGTKTGHIYSSSVPKRGEGSQQGVKMRACVLDLLNIKIWQTR